MTSADLVERVVDWYDEHARDLPWRADDATPWGVLVSEIMLQQTPVARVLGPWADWLGRWPTPAAMAAASPADVIRAWGRLGYPRRALRLRDAAAAIVERHGGEVPADHDALRALPGIGDYTAAAVASFAYQRRHAVLDTNVRRVLGRVLDGRDLPPASVSKAERARAQALLPADGSSAARWSVAVMELGALVCTAANPACPRCPVEDACAWLAAGRPAGERPRGQAYAGTDRQCRGAILARLRDADRPLSDAEAVGRWPDAAQAARALASLIDDGLAARTEGGVSLPG